MFKNYYNYNSWEIEQQMISYSLKEWCLLGNSGFRLLSPNCILTILQQAWRMNRASLIPTLSPLVSFLWHTLFKEARKNDNFNSWKEKGLDKFGRLGRGRTMYPLVVISLRVGESGRLQLQYQQVRNIVLLLMKNSNPFRLKRVFESCFSAVVNRKQLSSVYKILVKNVNVPEKVKFQWEN